MKHEYKKKMFLIFHGRFPSDKAASLFVAKSAETFAREGIEVILLVPRRIGREQGNPYAYYRVEQNFRIVYLPVLDIGRIWFLQPARFLLSFLSFSLSSFFYLLMKTSGNDIVYSNETLPLFLASFIHPNVFYEMHDFPESKLGLFGVFIRRMRGVVIHNQWKADKAGELFRVSGSHILCEPNAVDIREFDIPISKDEARRKLDLPLDKKIAVYTGHLYSWKGVDTLAQAAKELPDNYLVVFVGGNSEDVQRFRSAHGATSMIRIIGFRPHHEIPLWQKAADVLVLPNTAKEDISKYYTSPMKLFEYAASKRPIVASRIPSITELVDDTSAFLVEPDNASELANGIERACQNRDSLDERSYVAYTRISSVHTWEKRAERIIDFMKTT
ncbi:MAG TPA: glycosyltransferase family 4 protein [Candidatus Paceibacterota bacterium]|nr:glycosyltransferase family 4 protein [Candidatus Paceibacterota bacterium]